MSLLAIAIVMIVAEMVIVFVGTFFGYRVAAEGEENCFHDVTELVAVNLHVVRDLRRLFLRMFLGLWYVVEG